MKLQKNISNILSYDRGLNLTEVVALPLACQRKLNDIPLVIRVNICFHVPLFSFQRLFYAFKKRFESKVARKRCQVHVR